MNLWSSLAGTVEVQLTAADLPQALTFMEKAGITLQNAVYIDDLSMVFTIYRKDCNQLLCLCKKRGYCLQLKHKTGLYWTIMRLWKRPVLVVGMLALFFLSVWTPGRVFFVYTEGNCAVPTNLILEQAAQCGIEFGAKRADVRSEKVKNALLQRMPQLQWAGVNTYGCVAVISVTERQIVHEENNKDTVCSIVASVDGVIREMTVTQGTALCAVGDAVKAGQILVSGYTDCGLTIRAQQAEGEIHGETIRCLSAVFPRNYERRTEKEAVIKKYSLIIGKNRINFHNSSGILDGECVRIYSEKYVTLPGGFRLPVAIVTEEYIYYESEISVYENADSILQAYMEELLCQRLHAGHILTRSLTMTDQEDLFRIDGIYGCYEMIGILRPEECLPNYENN